MRQPHAPRRSLRAVGAAVVALLLLGPWAAAPAVAHDALLGSEPADGEEVARGPAEVLLTFSADQLDLGTAVQVLDGEDRDWADGTPAVDGPVVRQRLDPDMPAGTYDVTWRAVSSDGHPLTGTFSFVVASGPVEPSPTPTPSPTETEQPTPEPTPSSSDSQAPTTPPQDEGVVGSGTWPMAVVPGVLALAALAALVLVGRRKRR